MCHFSHVFNDKQIAATTRPAQLNDAPVALSRSHTVCAPPPPAKFNRRRAGADCSTQNYECRATDAVLMQQMRRGIFESIVVSELCSMEHNPVQDDLWAATECAFWK